ncbi:MAG: stage V sporulation protein AC [Ruminococcus sp.]|nr:stage V sporulation protein AC [Ruminococcus sp.]
MINEQEYSKIVKKNSPNSNTPVNCIKAFLVGGGICALGQGILELYSATGLSSELSKTLTSVTLVFLGILFTALHLYDRLAKHAGAGTLVPITGFANSMASPAMEFKSEGYVLGLGAKMFVISGSVFVYGTLAATLWGIIYFFIR